MDEKSNRKAGFGSIEDRICAFRDRMAPALHLFPQNIVEKLTEGGFFTAPASTKYHGAYEGGLFDHYHMGAFVDQKEWNDYTRAIHKYPNVLWTHTADMIAAHILEIDK